MLKNKHRRTLVDERLEFIFVRSAMLIIQQVRNNYINDEAISLCLDECYFKLKDKDE